MQNKHLYSLLDTSYTTIHVVFGAVARTEEVSVKRPHIKMTNDGFDPGEITQVYTYKVAKDDNIAVGDAVVVDTPRDGLKIVRVTAVHETPQIDLDAPFEYRWIIQKIDRTRYDEQVQRERKFQSMMLEVERVNQRERVLNDMRANLPDNSEARRLFDSATTMIDVPAVAPPPPPGAGDNQKKL